jgi:hypothetical protein
VFELPKWKGDAKPLEPVNGKYQFAAGGVPMAMALGNMDVANDPKKTNPMDEVVLLTKTPGKEGDTYAIEVFTVDANNPGLHQLTLIQAMSVTSGDPPWSDPVDIAVGMFEGSGDKYRDVVVLQQGTGDVRYFVNNGSSLEQVGSFAVGVAPLELAAADFNADGYCDYAVLFKDNIQVLLGIDGKLFTSPQPVGPSSLGLKDPAALTVVDVNNDGKDDLAFVERAGNKVTMMLNT